MPLMRKTVVFAYRLPSLCLAVSLLGAGNVWPNGFVSSREQEGKIGEPKQRAIILHEQGHEEIILQAEYDGPAQEFGWLIPVPAPPKVSPDSMDCFHDLSRIEQDLSWPRARAKMMWPEEVDWS